MSTQDDERESLIRRYMDMFGYDRSQAEQAAAIALREIPGDVIEVPDDEP